MESREALPPVAWSKGNSRSPRSPTMLTAGGRAGAPLTGLSQFFLSVAPNCMPPPAPRCHVQARWEQDGAGGRRGAAHSDGRLSPPGRLAGGGTMSEGMCCRRGWGGQCSSPTLKSEHSHVDP